MFRDRIRDTYRDLSRSQRKIADFLMSSYREAAFMTGSKLAAAAGVDVATVTRFAQRLGYRGYPDLAAEIQKAVMEEMSTAFRPLPEQAGLGQVVLRNLAIDRENLDRTMGRLSPEQAQQAVEMLRSARRVIVTGQWVPGLLAQVFAEYLRLLGLDAIAVYGDTAVAAAHVLDLGQGDVVVAIGSSAFCRDSGLLLRLARGRGARTVAISSSDVSPVAREAELLFVCPSSGAVQAPSLTTLVAMTMALFQALATERVGLLGERLAQFEKAITALSQEAETPETPSNTFPNG